MWLEEVDHNRGYTPITAFFYVSIMRIRAIVRGRNISHTSVHTTLGEHASLPRAKSTRIDSKRLCTTG
ncbi:unnamed protein product [Acanthoscelides obtectus]|uniref:Uncharacterized protein n=1 Tax=Acanthoscelides obtectus TaxID=200917 RepID=A0A9P0LBX6_ACAOB|nr:unnamed protein product [Acanthoscelides obtectus]CAK1674045.1 hypothetical protein AOBTE_LOCUS29513 [Acanthoscelides obtectus]